MKKKPTVDIDDFIESLRETPEGDLFNPWWQNDPENDDYTNASEIRRHQLKFYLQERLGRTRFLLIGEALGYQGGHFSGIAMTSERMLLGKQAGKGIWPEHIFTLKMPCRTSKETIKTEGSALAAIVARLYQPLKKLINIAITINRPAGNPTSRLLNIFFFFIRLASQYSMNFCSSGVSIFLHFIN